MSPCVDCLRPHPVCCVLGKQCLKLYVCCVCNDLMLVSCILALCFSAFPVTHSLALFCLPSPLPHPIHLFSSFPLLRSSPHHLPPYHSLLPTLPISSSLPLLGLAQWTSVSGLAILFGVIQFVALAVYCVLLIPYAQ